ncbi:MAG: rod shape-determining protein RodA [Candidatus Neomarinimicrobiota bacterium]
MWSVLYGKFREAPASILVAALVLTLIGFISINSVSHHQELTLTSTTFFRQLVWTLPALVMMLVTLALSRKNIYKYTILAYVGILLLLLLPFAGPKVAGTYRWITLGPVNFQPSEFAKIIVVLVLARYLSNPRVRLDRMTVVIVPLLLVAVPTAIVLRQPDLGTAIIIASPVLVMMFWSGVRPYHLFLLIAPFFSVLTAFHPVSFWIWAIILLLVLYLSRPTLITGVLIYFSNIFLGLLAPTLWSLLKPYQQSRILTVLNPKLDPLGAGYQIIQSQTAIGSGGFFGKGWGQGTQTQLKFLPVQETDFIVSVIGEEFGFVTICLIMVLFGWMLLKMIKRAYDSDNRFSGLVIIGIMVLLLAHLFVNTAMAVGLIPVKGLPLPFISYGGSFLLSCYIMIGLVLNLSINYSE